jgi:hypothetical protein
MDFDKLMEKVSKWLSDPRAREVIKSLIYVLLPLQETMAKEKKKVERELQEVFGRRERSLTRSRGGGAVPSQVPAEARMPESPGPGDEQAAREDLIRILFGRRRQ